MERIEAFEAELGVRLPPAVREFYGLAGQRHDLFSNQDILLSVDQRQMYVDEGALIVRHENQGVCRWGILLDHLDQDDPPVVVLAEVADTSQRRWEPWSDTLSAVVIQWLIYESCMRPETGDLATELADPDGLADITARGEVLEIVPFPTGQASAQTGALWRLVDDVVVLADESTILISARTSQNAEAFRKRYPADWLDDDAAEPGDEADPDDEDLGPKHPAFAAHFRDPIYDDQGDDFAPFGNNEGWDTVVEAAKRIDELDGSTTLAQIDPEWFEDEAAVVAGLHDDDVDMVDFTIGAGFALLRLTGQIDDVGRGWVLQALDARDRVYGPQPQTERMRADLLSFRPG
ncbi:hypothetical protein [Promicromonospora sp. NPDC019610]|uniref:hypothetical protein n=1 Tax=Promicromonospora sp. NPDC019610 TaxID=3364405 RepID=UPI0037B45454